MADCNFFCLDKEHSGSSDCETQCAACACGPVAWLHKEHKTAYVITARVKELWEKVDPKHVGNYTIPLCAIPTGWRLVPETPNAAMFMAACRVIDPTGNAMWDGIKSAALKYWIAMLAAAPQLGGVNREECSPSKSGGQQSATAAHSIGQLPQFERLRWALANLMEGVHVHPGSALEAQTREIDEAMDALADCAFYSETGGQPELVGRILKPGEKAEHPEFIKGMVYAANLYEQVDPASDYERQRKLPGAGAMGAVLEFRDLIRKEAGHG